MKIGDLFFGVHADDAGFQSEIVRSAGKAGDAGGAALGARMSEGLKRRQVNPWPGSG